MLQEQASIPRTETKADSTLLPNLFWRPLHHASLHVLKRLLRNENITIVFPDGARTVIGSAECDAPVWHIHSFYSLPRMLLNPWYRIGSHYVRGLWHVENGSLADLLAILVRVGKNSEQHSAFGRIIFWVRRTLFAYQQRYGAQRSIKNVEQHYDSGDELFRSFLDSGLNYTCADFEHGASNIDDAQMTKLRNALKRVRLMPGHRLLEIGSGWGALSRLACVEYGANVTALTLSKNQIKYSRELAATLQISTNLKYFLEDYRRHEIHKECIYDRVMSIGMLEHVGLWQLKSYFCEISRLLKPDGIALIHTISRRHAGVTNPWIERHIFPGGYIAQDAEILKAAEDAGLAA